MREIEGAVSLFKFLERAAVGKREPREEWNRYARERGFSYEPLGLSWWLPTDWKPCMRARDPSSRLTLAVSTPPFSRERTKVSGERAGGVGVVVSVFSAGPSGGRGGRKAAIDDADFASRFYVRENREGAAAELLDAPLRKNLREFERGDLTFDNGRIELTWTGIEDRAAVLDAAFALVEAATKR